MAVVLVFLSTLLWNLISGAEVSNHEAILSHFCKHDIDCNFKYGQCNIGRSQCECKKDYVPSDDNKECLAVGQTIGFPCTENKQCLLANSTCLNFECTCISGYHYVDQKCWQSIAFGAPCENNQDCSLVIGAFCTEKKVCGCGGKGVISNSGKKCLSIAKNISDDCEEEVQCGMKFMNSLCVDGKCRCNEKSHFEADLGECIVNIGLDDSCARNHDCYQGERDMSLNARVSLCVNNQCVCADGYRRNGDKCVKNGAASHLSCSLVLMLLSIFNFLQK